MKLVRSLVILGFFCFFSQIIFCQDIIFLQDGTEIESKVLEINVNDIKYKKQSNLEGPSYTIQKSEVFMIKYENGSKEMFTNSSSSTKASSSKPSKTELDKTILNQETSTTNYQNTNTTEFKKFKVKVGGAYGSVNFYEGGIYKSKYEFRRSLSGNSDLTALLDKGLSQRTIGYAIQIPFQIYSWYLFWESLYDGFQYYNLTGGLIGLGGSLIGGAIASAGNNKIFSVVNQFNDRKGLSFGSSNNGIGLVYQF